jgi:hypothetical protein
MDALPVAVPSWLSSSRNRVTGRQDQLVGQIQERSASRRKRPTADTVAFSFSSRNCNLRVGVCPGAGRRRAALSQAYLFLYRYKSTGFLSSIRKHYSGHGVFAFSHRRLTNLFQTKNWRRLHVCCSLGNETREYIRKPVRPFNVPSRLGNLILSLPKAESQYEEICMKRHK